jgi:hypothetical protein
METKLLNIRQLYEYYTCILIKKILTKSFQSNIKFYKKSDSHNLRNNDKLLLPRVRTTHGQRTILFDGVQLYNKLPNHIKASESINIFKHKLKDHISKYNV